MGIMGKIVYLQRINHFSLMHTKSIFSCAGISLSILLALASCGGKGHYAANETTTDSANITYVTMENPEIFPYRYENGKMGYVDSDGQPRIEGKYDIADEFHEGLAAVKMGDYWGYINGNGDLVIKLQYGQAEPFENGRAKVSKNNLFGYIDQNGKEIIKCRYDAIEPFNNGEAYAIRDNKKGIIDTSGNELLSCSYDDVYRYNDNLLTLKSGNQYGLAKSASKEVVLPCEYLVPGYSGKYKDTEGNGYIFFKKGGDGEKYGLMTETGELVFGPRYDDHGNIEANGWVRVQLDGKIGYIALDGKEMIPCRYVDSEALPSRYILRQGTNEYVLADNTSGKILTTAPFEKMRRFNDNLLYVENESGRSGLIDLNGRQIIKCDYDFRTSGDFIYLSRRTGGIDYYGVARANDGKILVDCDRYTNMKDFQERGNRYAEVFTKPHSLFPVGLINSNGKEVIPCNNMYIYQVSGGKARVKDMQGNLKEVTLAE